jgi:hypothetical protein
MKSTINQKILIWKTPDLPFILNFISPLSISNKQMKMDDQQNYFRDLLEGCDNVVVKALCCKPVRITMRWVFLN